TVATGEANMESMLVGIAPMGALVGLIDLDINGFVLGSEMAALIASLFSALFASLANVAIGNLFNVNGV
ncbi:MAG: hypothetical protein ACYSVY_19855, partial [Planctomycetota bacterium]